MISGNKLHMSSILSLMAKVVNTYVPVMFFIFIFNKCAKISKIIFLPCLYAVLCVDFFGNKAEDIILRDKAVT